MVRPIALKTKHTVVFVFVILMGTLGTAEADYVFGEAVNLGPTINSIANEQAPSISADGLELYFSDHEGAPYRSGGFGSSDLWVTTRPTKDDPWGVPVNLGPVVNSSHSDEHPSISADGLELYFGSTRAGGSGTHDLWVTTRLTKDLPWTEPVNLGSTVNSMDSEWDPEISADGLSLYFADYLNFRLGGYGIWDLYVTRRDTVTSAWGTPVNMGLPINSSSRDASPSISADSLVLFLNTERLGGAGGSDIWMARRMSQDADWGPPIPLGPAVNQAGFDAAPEISTDGSTLYFGSERPGGSGNVDLWQSSITRIVDFSGDGQIDGKDVLVLTDCWGTDDSLCDIGPMPWGDGVVDVEDLRVLAEYIGEPVDDPTLVAHWALDELQGEVACDSAGGQDGILMGSPIWEPESGMVGGALHFDGVDDCIETPYVLDSSTGPFSVLAWVCGGGSGQVIVCQGGGATWLVVQDDGFLGTELTGGSASSLISTTCITDGNWHRVGLTWDGFNRTLYVDDVAVAADMLPGLGNQGTNLYIGAAGPGNRRRASTFFSGLIDDVRIYNRAVKP